MKTSKRLLSILLMLTMLVSMFTVMAFADNTETETATLSFEIVGKGKIVLRKTNKSGETVFSREVTRDFTMDKAPLDFLESLEVVAVADEGYTGKLYYNDSEISSGSLTMTAIAWNHSFKAVFTEATSEKPPVTPPQPEEPEQINLKLNINTNGVKGAKVFFRDTQDITENTNDFAIDKADLNNGLWFFTTSAEQEYTVSWKMNGSEVSSKTRYDLPKTLAAGNHTLTVTFDEKTTPVEEKHTLTVVVETVNGVTYGTVKYNGNQGTVLTDELVADAKVTAEAVANSGYQFVKWMADGVNLTNTELKKEKLTFTMPDKDAKVTAVFTEKSSSSHTHKWVEKFNDTYHWKECSRCGDKTSKEKHTIIYAYDKYGYRYDKCKYCDWTSDYSYNHSSSHKDYTYEDINATYHWKTCKKCDYSVKEYHTWIKNTDRKTRDSYPYVCKYCDRLSKTDYTDLPFYDVDGNVWYYDDVLYAYINGYMDGLSAGQFAPNQNTTRAQIVTILWRLTGEPRATKRNPFTDVSSSQYYYDAISWAYDAGVVDGFDARTFKPDQNVTREQLAAILYRYAKYMNLSTSGSAYLAKYRDADKIASWAYDAMAWANYRGLINGTSATRIDPKGYATRAQIAAILHRFAVEYGA